MVSIRCHFDFMNQTFMINGLLNALNSDIFICDLLSIFLGPNLSVIILLTPIVEISLKEIITYLLKCRSLL